MAQLPPLPQITGDFDIILDVYTHESARPPTNAISPEYGDVARLEALGRKAAELAVTYHLFCQGTTANPMRPLTQAEDIPDLCANALHHTKISSWMDAYNMKKNIRCHPHDFINDNEVLTHIFFAYVGALYIRNGGETIMSWISGLIDPESTPPLPPSSPPPAPAGPPPQSPPPAMMSPPMASPVPMNYQPPLGAATGNLDQLITLQVVNQTAQQKGYTVTYPATSEGPPHAPTWTVRCCLNGQDAGVAQARSQKAAKEEAARMAFRNMNWP
ncbi:hypothetical protein BDZ89DRAFT_981186 [Hymenopellis radicata]|nr:hypothetical protein BDZ89DRAFT_981186 [Hymenopellis radicata]